MKDEKVDYTTRLIMQSKKGRNTSFLELSGFLVPKIYPVIFSLVPKEKIAIQIFLKVLLRAKKNIQKLENEDHFIPWLRKLSIIESMNYLRDVERIDLQYTEVEELCTRYHFKLSEVEKEFLLLSCKERVALSLTEIAGLNATQISKVMKSVTEKTVLEIVRNARNKLIKKFPFDEIRSLSEKGWKELNKNLINLDTGSKLDINDFEFEIINKYISYSRTILKGTLRHLIPSELIMSALREELHKYAESIIEEELQGKKHKKKVRIKVDKSNVKILPTTKRKSNDKNVKSIEFSLQPLLEKHSKKLKFVELLIVSIFLIYLGYNLFASAGSSWSIEKSRGDVEIIPSSASHPELTEGDELITGNNSTATLVLSNSASLNVYPKTRLQLTEVSGSNNFFELKAGKIELNILKAEHGNTLNVDDYNYTFKFSDGIVNLNNSNFSLEKTSKSFYLNVLAGWVNIEHKGRNIFLVKNYIYSKNLLAPHHIEASKVFVNILKRNYNDLTDADEINTIVQSATDKDAITLWHLLYLTSESNRKEIVEKID